MEASHDGYFLRRQQAVDGNFQLGNFNRMLDKSVMSDLIAHRIRERLELLGKSASSVSLEAGLSRSAVQDILDGKSKSPRISTLQKLARPLQCTLQYLSGEEYEAPAPLPEMWPAQLVEIPIAGRVEAGVFVEVDPWSDAIEPATIVAARDPRFPRARMVAFAVNGDSMNLAGINQGDIIIAVDAIDAELPFRNGMTVVVQRTADNGSTIEWTVKEVATFRDRVELVPRSTNKRHKPIVIRRAPDEYNDTDWLKSNDGTEIRIIAIVVRVTKELPV